jgi:hypothetical protein
MFVVLFIRYGISSNAGYFICLRQGVNVAFRVFRIACGLPGAHIATFVSRILTPIHRCVVQTLSSGIHVTCK